MARIEYTLAGDISPSVRNAVIEVKPRSALKHVLRKLNHGYADYLFVIYFGMAYVSLWMGPGSHRGYL